MASKKKALFELPVSYGSVSFGTKTAKVSISATRDNLKVGVADKNFCDRRLTVRIVATPVGDQPGQGRLEGMEDTLEMSAVVDVKSFNVSAEKIGFGLTFNKKDAANGHTHLNEFAGRQGVLYVNDVGDIPEPEKSEPEEETAGDEE